MLRKLMKYELRALMPWYLLSGGVVLLLSGIVRLVYFLTNNGERPFITMGAVGMTVMLWIAVIAMFSIAVIVPVVRFYRNLLRDEGYLMFTLPVSSGQLYLSKLFSALIGELFAILVAVLCFVIVVLSNPGVFSLLSEFKETILEVFAQLTTTGEKVLAIIEIVISIPSAILYPFVLSYACLSIGQLAKKNKLLYAFLAFLGFNTAINILQWIVQIAFTFGFALADVERLGILMELQIGLSLLAQVAVDVACIVIANHILKKKLNLE